MSVVIRSGVRPLTDAQRGLLVMNWPVERPAEHELTDDVRDLIARDIMYVEDVGNGWQRLGLTASGRSLADNIRDPFRKGAVMSRDGGEEGGEAMNDRLEIEYCYGNWSALQKGTVWRRTGAFNSREELMDALVSGRARWQRLDVDAREWVDEVQS